MIDPRSTVTSRRDFLRVGLVGLVTPSLLACGGLGPEVAGGQQTTPRLSARPGSPGLEAPVGESVLGLGVGRDGLLYVPLSYSPEVPLPLVIGLHGSGGSAAAWKSWYAVADRWDFVFLAIDSRGYTWDLVNGYFGPDVAFVDAALQHTFDRCAIDPSRVALTGYSNGASYGLSLGVLNGDLFTDLLGFAPGFFLPLGPLVGKPRIFLAHGTSDPVASVVGTRQLAVDLETEGYDVTFREFEGDHQIPADVARGGVAWFLQAPESPLNTTTRP